MNGSRAMQPSHGDSAEPPETRARARWSAFGFAPRAAGGGELRGGHLRLVFAIRLWNDDTLLKHGEDSTAWSAFAARIEAASSGETRRGDRVALFRRIDSDDARLLELIPTVRELVREGDIAIWHAGEEALASLFGTREAAWHVQPRGRRPPVPVSWRGIELWASRSGIAYASVAIETREESAIRGDPGGAFARYLDLVHFTRHLRARAGTRIVAEAKDAPRCAPPFRDARWQTAPDGRHVLETGTHALADWLVELLTGDASLDYASVALENPAAARAYAFALLERQGGPAAGAPDVDDVAAQLVEMAHADRVMNRLIADDESGAGMTSIRYAHDARFAVSRECTAFVAIDQPGDEFWLSGMPTHLGQEYFAIQMLTLLQRHQLDELRRLVAVANARGWEVWNRLESRTIEVKARGFQVEVSARSNHARFEQIVRAVLRVDRAYEVATELIDSVLEAHIAHQQEIANEARERLQAEERESDRNLQWIAVLFVFPSLVLTVLNVTIKGLTVGEGSDGLEPMTVALVTLAAFVVAVLAASLLPAVLRAVGPTLPGRGGRVTGARPRPPA